MVNSIITYSVVLATTAPIIISLIQTENATFSAKIEIFEPGHMKFRKIKGKFDKTSLVVLPTTAPIIDTLTQTRNGTFCAIFVSEVEDFRACTYEILKNKR